MKKTSIVTLIVFGAVLGGVFLMGNKVQYSTTDSAFNKTYWEKEIEIRGAVRAYEAFKKKNTESPSARQHFSAHVMGILLFEKLGLQGVTVCDSSFGFGCYHGFFAGAISLGGTESIAKLDEICTKTYGTLGTGCQHGLGHGILEYVGYEHIDQALVMCNTFTKQPTPLLGCTSGVFMEFFTPLAGADDTLEPMRRALDSQHPYTPCTTVASAFQKSCYFQLGQWFRSTPSTDYAKLCRGLTGSARTYCFLGVGSDIPRDGYVVSDIHATCALLTGDDELACRAGASWMFFAMPEHKPDALKLCAYPDTERQSECITLADLTEGLDTSFGNNKP